MQRSNGPNLPYAVAAGVIPVDSGWLVASAKLQGVTLAVENPRVLETFIAVIDEKPPFSVIALHAPVGWLDHPVPGGRTCDRAARSLLGTEGGAAVHSAPSRLTFDGLPGEPNEDLDAVTVALLPRYQEVLSEMAPYRQRTIFETNPELTFYELNDHRPLRGANSCANSVDERRQLLRNKISDVDRIIDAVVPGVTPEQLLDAAACLWTARRIMAKAGIRLPADAEWDSQGLKMELMR